MSRCRLRWMHIPIGAQALVAFGEISSGRAALEGDPVALGNQSILESVRDEPRRPRPVSPDPQMC